MRFLSLLYPTLVFFTTAACGQPIKWEKDVPGKFFKVHHDCRHCTSTPDVPGLKTAALFSIVERLPMIHTPTGYELHEQVRTRTENKRYIGALNFKFYTFYSFEGGKTQLSTEPYSFAIRLNDPAELVNDKSKIDLSLPNNNKPGDPWADLPDMYTDTLELTYQMLNGYPVGQAYDSGWGYRVWVINPNHIRFFRPVTQDEYVRRFLGKLQYDIAELEKGIAEQKKTPEAFPEVDLSGVPDSLRAQIRKTLEEARKGAEEVNRKLAPDMERLLKQNQKYLAFLKSKQQYYQKMLSNMTSAQRKAPAYFVYYQNDAKIIDKEGNTVEKIEGHLQNEPYEGVDAMPNLPVKPLYTFVKNPFDASQPSTAFQLITVVHPYDADVNKIKDWIRNEGIQKLDYKAMAALMSR